MKRHIFVKRTTAILMMLAVVLVTAGIRPVRAHAENFQFITDIRLASGIDGSSRLEEDGYSVRAVGLNASVDDDHQVWLGYKINDGDPITDIVISDNAGDTLESGDGIKYERAGNVDVDKGNGNGGGYLYFTHNKKAGAPLVGLDVLRSDTGNGKKLLPITNDGAEIVRRTDGIPADMEVNSDTTIYVAQIRDGLVRPYISEIAVVQSEDKENAVFKAACAGYNYYVEGDVDNSKETYTILAYDRSADVNDAVTNLVALTADLTKYLEDGQVIAGDGRDSEPQEEAADETAPEENPEGENPEEAQAGEAGAEAPVEEEPEAAETQDAAPGEEAEGEQADGQENADGQEVPAEAQQPAASDDDEAPDKAVSTDVTVKMTAEAVDLTGIEYDRVSSTVIDGKIPYYLYMTKDRKAGNPITMMYDGNSTDVTGTTFGTWAYGYFSSKGLSNANSYIVNEDLLEKFKDNQEAYIKLPVTLLSGETDEEGGFALKGKSLKLAFLTAEEGLPADGYTLNGLRKATYEPPKMERTERNYDGDKTAASAFGKAGPIVICIGVLLAAAAVFAGWRVLRKKKRPLA